MLRRFFPTPTDDGLDAAAGSPSTDAPGAGEPDLAALPLVGITRRRAAILLGVLVAAWIVILFARQISEAATATGRAEELIAANARQQTALVGLQAELERIQQPAFIAQEARGYGLGGPREIAFTLGVGAPALDANAPGSAAQRLGAPTPVSPLERWLTLLFGPSG
ncbi:MAG: hypothetical protein ABI553_03065 [Chloroflexota bacterium]